jgi:hypothetical protein
MAIQKVDVDNVHRYWNGEHSVVYTLQGREESFGSEATVHQGKLGVWD